MTYSFKKGLIKALTAIAIFGIPFFVTNFPDIANLTIGAVLTLLVNYIKIKISK